MRKVSAGGIHIYIYVGELVAIDDAEVTEEDLFQLICFGDHDSYVFD